MHITADTACACVHTHHYTPTTDATFIPTPSPQPDAALHITALRIPADKVVGTTLSLAFKAPCDTFEVCVCGGAMHRRVVVRERWGSTQWLRLLTLRCLLRCNWQPELTTSGFCPTRRPLPAPRPPSPTTSPPPPTTTAAPVGGWAVGTPGGAGVWHDSDAGRVCPGCCGDALTGHMPGRPHPTPLPSVQCSSWMCPPP